MAATIAEINHLMGPKVSDTKEFNLWLYSDADTAQGAMDAAGWFAVKGSTSGDGMFNDGDIILTVGGAVGSRTLGVMIVTDPAAGTATHLVVTAP